MANKKTYKAKYIKGRRNTEVEDAAISKLTKMTREDKSNFSVYGFIKKGEWDADDSETID